MSVQELIDTYLKGWELGDGSLSLSATADDFFYLDPNTGRIERDGFVQFVEDFKADAAAFLEGRVLNPFLEYRDVVTERADDGSATVWCWWQARETPIEGSALIKVDADGVRNERIAYFSKLPDDPGPLC